MPAVTMSRAEQSRVASQQAYACRRTRRAAIPVHNETHYRILATPASARTPQDEADHLKALRTVYQAHVAEISWWHAAAHHLVLQITERAQTCGNYLQVGQDERAMTVHRYYHGAANEDSALRDLERAWRALEKLRGLLSVAAEETYLQAVVDDMRAVCDSHASRNITLAEELVRAD